MVLSDYVNQCTHKYAVCPVWFLCWVLRVSAADVEAAVVPEGDGGGDAHREVFHGAPRQSGVTAQDLHGRLDLQGSLAA